LTSADADVRPNVRELLARQPFEVSPDAAVVRAVSDAVAAETGSAPAVVGAPYWTDAALIADAGIPTVLFGPVGGGIHQRVEWVDLASVRVVHGVLARVVRSICSGEP